MATSASSPTGVQFEQSPSLPPTVPTNPAPGNAAVQETVVNFTAGGGSNNGGHGSGLAKFRSAAKHVAHLSKGSTALRPPGAEPGVDPRRAAANELYSHIQQKCSIQIVNYNATRATFDEGIENADLERYMREGQPSWAKVRWIKIGGVSWDVIRVLALACDLHPLSIEDVLHSRRTSQSKADYYMQHLFLSLLCHTVGQNGNDVDLADEPSAVDEQLADVTVVGTPDEKDSTDDSGNDGLPQPATAVGGTKSQSKRQRLRAKASSFLSESSREKAANIAILQELKRGDRVDVDIRNLYVFLLRDGTVISIHQTPDPNFASAIMNRLRHRDGLLRSNPDASLLVQSLLDLVVDNALEVVDKYHEKILKLERDILLRPHIKTVRNLHILSGDLVLHKRTLGPLKTLVYGLRRYDKDRAIALVVSKSGNTEAAAGVTGFMSHRAKIYLADVVDHMEYILDSLDTFSGIAEALVNYTFNQISYETNETMKLLTFATIIFFPLTFLTGYFGQNFTPFPGVDNHSDLLFWEIAIPLTVVITLAFMWGPLMEFFGRLKKKIIAKRIDQRIVRR
jgi:Mg2+ and Co2+ transporter CorA